MINFLFFFLFLFILFTILVIFLYKTDTSTTKIINKNKIIIPLNIFQTWETKQLPPKMKECVESIKYENPEFKHYLFDDKDCRYHKTKYYL